MLRLGSFLWLLRVLHALFLRGPSRRCFCRPLSLSWFCVPFGASPFGFFGFLSVVSVCVSLVFCCFCCAPSWVWEGPAFSGLVFGSCWFPSLLLPPLPPRLVPCGALVQFHAGTSLWVSGCSCDGSVALPLCWECGCALSSFIHFVSWQQRLLSLVWGCYHPLHHVAGAVRMLSLTTLRYSSG